MANKKPLWQRKHVSIEEFEKEERALTKQINRSIRNIEKNKTQEYFDRLKSEGKYKN